MKENQDILAFWNQRTKQNQKEKIEQKTKVFLRQKNNLNNSLCFSKEKKKPSLFLSKMKPQKTWLFSRASQLSGTTSKTLRDSLCFKKTNEQMKNPKTKVRKPKNCFWIVDSVYALKPISQIKRNSIEII